MFDPAQLVAVWVGVHGAVVALVVALRVWGRVSGV